MKTKTTLLQFAIMRGILSSVVMSDKALEASKSARFISFEKNTLRVVAQTEKSEPDEIGLTEMAKAIGQHYGINVELLALMGPLPADDDQELEQTVAREEVECDFPACMMEAAIKSGGKDTKPSAEAVVGEILAMLLKRVKG